MSSSAIGQASATAPSRNGKPEKEWLSRKEAAIYLTSIGCKIAPQTLANMASNRNAGMGPTFTRAGWSSAQYARADLDRWAAARMMRIG